jgi:hypothetical protein
LIEELWQRVVACFAPQDPLFAHQVLGNALFFETFARLRQGVPQDGVLFERAIQALESLGLSRKDYRWDRPRIRAVSSGAHEIAAARPAYGQHRDTWYANPQAQLNHWIPLHEILEEERMGFFPEVFAQAIPNSSAGFFLKDWEKQGGFQAYSKPQASEQFHPVPDSPLDWSKATRVSVAPGQLLQFCAQHLHGTVPHSSGRTRYTLELRAIHQEDHRSGRGPVNVDARCTGNLWDRYESG